ncbi:hypothetical protein [Celeribacter indicus]|uniref:Uncharacterized protein n=1 Tax=Celeribacter indicus TaxID=1208324 RepID=A0A0B5E3C2_9RHOB|nr:hypothetical protein [Celeribacter indicus]AJE47890.1 hypothetical protein P73_3175 [Celeribacter indicus]SDW26132.1 hypothetical protein SAMN05443573_102164 [Celeribacter indicus]
MTDATAAALPLSDHDDNDRGHAGTTGEATPRGVAMVLLAVVAVIAALVYGAFAIGPWVLGVTALATVPVIYVVLILLTTGH